MMTILIRTLHMFLKALTQQWNTLVKNVGKSTASTLITYITIGILFEIFWLTLLLSVLILINTLN